METENPVSQQNSSGSKHDKTLSPPENSHPKSQEENIREPPNINSSPRNIVRDRNSISRSRSRSKSLSIQRSHHNNSNSNILLLNGKFLNFQKKIIIPEAEAKVLQNPNIINLLKKLKTMMVRKQIFFILKL